MTSGDVPVPPGLLCTCGRAAVEATLTERFGVVGWCGMSNLPPVEPCTSEDCTRTPGSPHSWLWCGSPRPFSPTERSLDIRATLDDEHVDWLGQVAAALQRGLFEPGELRDLIETLPAREVAAEAASRLLAGRFTVEAIERMRAVGVSPAAWLAEHPGADRCGCPDDRCIGFHHEQEGDCGCLPVVLELAVS